MIRFQIAFQKSRIPWPISKFLSCNGFRAYICQAKLCYIKNGKAYRINTVFCRRYLLLLFAFFNYTLFLLLWSKSTVFYSQARIHKIKFTYQQFQHVKSFRYSSIPYTIFDKALQNKFFSALSFVQNFCHFFEICHFSARNNLLMRKIYYFLHLCQKAIKEHNNSIDGFYQVTLSEFDISLKNHSTTAKFSY